MTAFSTTAVRMLLALLVAAGVGGAIYLGVRGGGDDNSQVAGKLTQTPTVVATTTAPSPTAPPTTSTPASTSEPQTSTPLLTATPDTRVPSMELPTLEQIQLGKDSKYFFEGQGDGCHWEEARRRDSFEGEELVIFQTDCAANFGFVFNTVSGDIHLLLP